MGRSIYAAIIIITTININIIINIRRGHLYGEICATRSKRRTVGAIWTNNWPYCFSLSRVGQCTAVVYNGTQYNTSAVIVVYNDIITGEEEEH